MRMLVATSLVLGLSAGLALAQGTSSGSGGGSRVRPGALRAAPEPERVERPFACGRSGCADSQRSRCAPDLEFAAAVRHGGFPAIAGVAAY